MPLIGGAKKLYQREYMRTWQRQRRSKQATGQSQPVGGGELDLVQRIEESRAKTEALLARVDAFLAEKKQNW